MKASFPYDTESSAIFKTIKRPVVQVSFWSSRMNHFLQFACLVDTGADYTLLPKTFSKDLGIDLEKDCVPYILSGIGGREKVFLLKQKLMIMVDKSKRKIPIGFLDRDNILPLLGRQECLDTFKITLE